MSLLNNIKLDIMTKTIEKETTLSAIAKQIETSQPYMSRLVNGGVTIINPTLLKVMDSLGYDIKLEYIPKEK